MADKTIRIEVKSKAELAALQQAGIAVDKVGDQTKITSNQFLAAQRNMKRLNAESRGLGGGSRNTARGILELSRAFEDLQFGLRGVLNNIPGILQSFGFSAGVAGVISITAVSLDALRRKFGLFGTEAKKNVEEVSDEMDRLGKRLSRTSREYDALSRSIDATAASEKALLKIELDGISELAKARQAEAVGKAEAGLAATTNPAEARRAAQEVATIEIDALNEAEEVRVRGRRTARQKARRELEIALEAQAETTRERDGAIKRLREGEIDEGRLRELNSQFGPGGARPAGLSDEDVRNLKDERKQLKKQQKDFEKEGGERERAIKLVEKSNAALEKWAVQVEVATTALNLVNTKQAADAPVDALRLQNQRRAIEKKRDDAIAKADKDRLDALEELRSAQQKSIDDIKDKEKKAREDSARSAEETASNLRRLEESAVEALVQLGQSDLIPDESKREIETLKTALRQPGIDRGAIADTNALLDTYVNAITDERAFISDGFRRLRDTLSRNQASIKTLQAQIGKGGNKRKGK